MKFFLLFLVIAFSQVNAETGYGSGAVAGTVEIEIAAYTEVDPLRGSLGNFQLKNSFVETIRRGGYPILSKDEVFDKNPQAVDAHYFATKFFEVLKSRFHRNGLDNNGLQIKVSTGMVYEGIAPNACGTSVNEHEIPSASWDEKTATAYFSGETEDARALSSSLDIVAHELAHGIISFTSKLNGTTEAKTLNESFADILATYMEFVIQPNMFDWMMGEDSHKNHNCGGVRYLNEPSRAFIPVVHNESNQIENIYLPSHIRKLYRGTGDRGGVHINSSIAPFVFYLFSQSVGIEKAIDVFYVAFTERLDANATLEKLKQATEELVLDNHLSVRQALQSAWATVGL